MSQEEGKREIVFQMTMSAARQMLEKGLISEDEYKQFDTKMQQKYRPIFGTLFSNIDLQYANCNRRDWRTDHRNSGISILGTDEGGLNHEYRITVCAVCRNSWWPYPYHWEST